AAGDPVDLARAEWPHFVGIGRVVGVGAGAVRLLDPADPVLQARRAGDGPGPGEGLRVAAERVELGLAVLADPFLRAGEGELVAEPWRIPEVAGLPRLRDEFSFSSPKEWIGEDGQDRKSTRLDSSH